jgi:hypothetical protein
MSNSCCDGYCPKRQVARNRLRLRLIAIFRYEDGQMQNNFIIRNQDDYLRAHITVLQPNRQKLEAEPQRDDVEKRARKRQALNGGRQPANLTLIPIR